MEKMIKITLKNGRCVTLCTARDFVYDNYYSTDVFDEKNNQIAYVTFKLENSKCFLIKIEITNQEFAHVGLGSILIEHMEEFARWNLPEEIALEWIDTEGMVDVLEHGKCISKETVDVLREIRSAFILEFEKIDNPVWTHEAMKRSTFWNMQRLNARKVLDKMKT